MDDMFLLFVNRYRGEVNKDIEQAFIIYYICEITAFTGSGFASK